MSARSRFANRSSGTPQLAALGCGTGKDAGEQRADSLIFQRDGVRLVPPHEVAAVADGCLKCDRHGSPLPGA